MQQRARPHLRKTGLGDVTLSVLFRFSPHHGIALALTQGLLKNPSLSKSDLAMSVNEHVKISGVWLGQKQQIFATAHARDSKASRPQPQAKGTAEGSPNTCLQNNTEDDS
jgi:hypothetical protein